VVGCLEPGASEPTVSNDIILKLREHFRLSKKILDLDLSIFGTVCKQSEA
jgi:hypothetical protein